MTRIWSVKRLIFKDEVQNGSTAYFIDTLARKMI